MSTNLVGEGKNSNCDKFEIGEKEHVVKRCPYIKSFDKSFFISNVDIF